MSRSLEKSGNNFHSYCLFNMDIKHLSEWAKQRKTQLLSKDSKWTNAYISAEADVSKTSVDRFLAGDIEDIKFSTVASIVHVLSNGLGYMCPCNLETQSNDCKNCNRCQALNEDSQKKVDHLKSQIAFYTDQLKAKDELLADRKNFLRLKDKTIQILSVLLGLCVVIIIGSLVMDLTNPAVGYFWLR